MVAGSKDVAGMGGAVDDLASDARALRTTVGDVPVRRGVDALAPGLFHDERPWLTVEVFGTPGAHLVGPGHELHSYAGQEIREFDDDAVVGGWAAVVNPVHEVGEGRECLGLGFADHMWRQQIETAEAGSDPPHLCLAVEVD